MADSKIRVLRPLEPTKPTKAAQRTATVAEVWVVYLTLPAARRVKPRTLAGYRAAITRYGPMLDASDPITTTAVDHWILDLHQKCKVSRDHANFCLRVLRTVTHAVWEHADTKATRKLYLAAKHAQALKTPQRAPRNPAPDVVPRALQACRNPAEETFILLMAATGLRLDEMLGLTTDSYVPHARALVVSGQRKDPYARKGTGNDHVVENLPLEFCERIEWVINHHRELVPKQGWRRNLPVPQYLFPWGPEYMRRFMERIRTQFGDDKHKYFPHRTAWHAFRHFSLNAKRDETGGDWTKMQKHLGHKTPAQVMSTYGALARGPSFTEPVALDRVMCHKPHEDDSATPPP